MDCCSVVIIGQQNTPYYDFPFVFELYMHPTYVDVVMKMMMKTMVGISHTIAITHSLAYYLLSTPYSYPAEPPKMHYVSPIADKLHPNLNTTGVVCVSLLGAPSERVMSVGE